MNSQSLLTVSEWIKALRDFNSDKKNTVNTGLLPLTLSTTAFACFCYVLLKKVVEVLRISNLLEVLWDVFSQ